MNIGVISGSSRPNNNTLRVAKAIAALAENVEIVDFQNFDIPSFAKGAMVPGEETIFQKDLIRVIDEADLLFVLTPEYNWFPTAEIIQMLHVLGNDTYKHIFDEKVIASIGVSAGRGGRMPAVQLNTVFSKIISYFNLNSVVSPKCFEAQEITQCIDNAGELQENQAFNAGLKQFIDYSVKLSKRWQPNA